MQVSALINDEPIGPVKGHISTNRTYETSEDSSMLW